jgi:hypothetical protein
MPNATKRRRSRSNEPYSPNNAIPEVPANMDNQAEPSPKRPRRMAACTRPSLVESDGEEEEEEPKPKKRGRLTSKGGKATTTKAEKLKDKDEKRKDYLPPPEPPYLHEGLARRSPDSVDHARVDARGLANGYPEQTSEEQHNSSALDASIDPALQSYTASSVAGFIISTSRARAVTCRPLTLLQCLDYTLRSLILLLGCRERPIILTVHLPRILEIRKQSYPSHLGPISQLDHHGFAHIRSVTDRASRLPRRVPWRGTSRASTLVFAVSLLSI